MTDFYEELYTEICKEIHADIRVDIHGDLYGYESIASAFAYRVTTLVSQVKELEEKLRQAQITMDSYADENQRFYDEIEELKSRLEHVTIISDGKIGLTEEPRGILHLVNSNAHLEEPEPKCNICGRIIFCGVDELCKEDPCGLKGK